MTRWIVTAQTRSEWPSKDYHFSDEKQARMFLHMCRRDGDYRAELRGAA